MEDYQDIKQKSRPFKKQHNHKVIRPIGIRVTQTKNNENPVNIGSSTSCGGSRRVRYASTKGCSIKTKSKSYELR